MYWRQRRKLMYKKVKFLIRDRTQIWVLFLISYLPLFFNDPGRVAADTKAYLYLDPFRLLERAAYMWQPELAFGTVTHQNIGYLWPIGPFFALGDLLSMPDWVVQRLWLGSIILAAGLGVRWFLKTLSWKGGAVLVASLSYMLSPYLLNYIDRHSVILLPWAGLPWLMALTVRSLRTPGWRHPALFGLVTLTIGGVNASSLLLVGLGPFIWLLWSALDKSATWKEVGKTASKIGTAFIATGVWWMAALLIQAQYGLPTLRLTENYRVVSDAATAPELFRGLGYWYFYGQGRVGAWIEPSTLYTRWALPLSFALPLLALLISAFVKFRYRGHLLALMFISMLIAIGSHPYDSPSIFGRIFREWTLSDSGLALRSTPRVLPLLLLSIAVFLGAGIAALSLFRPRLEHLATILISLLIIGNLSPLWTGSLLGETVQRPEEIPEYWNQTAEYLDLKDSSTRVLEIPGADFSAYRWGNSGDPLLPGLMDRPYASRELIPLGTEPSAELIVAFDREIQEGRFDKNSLAPMAQLMSVGDVVVRSDLQFERFRTPRPDELWAELVDTPGFSDPVEFGERVSNIAGPERPMLDEHTLASPPSHETPPPSAVFELKDQVKIVHLADPFRPIIISGDAEGIVHTASEGLLESGRPVIMSASYVESPDELASMLTPEARIVITDTNRKSGQRWGTIRETKGYTERLNEEPIRLDLSDHRLNPLGTHPSTISFSEQKETQVTASSYGNPVTFTAGDRPFHAIDSFPETSWTVGAFNKVIGEELRLSFDEKITIDKIRFAQVNGIGQNRWMTKVRVHFDDDHIDVELDEVSRSEPGQVVEFDSLFSSSVRIEILETDVGGLDYYAGVTGVGFSTIRVNDISPSESIRMPTDIVETLGQDVGSEFVVLVSRERSDPLDPIRSDPEEIISRTFTTPWERDFYLKGDVRLSTDAKSSLIDQLLGLEKISLKASSSLSGHLSSSPRSAFDSNFDTAWRTGIGNPINSALVYETEKAETFENITITYLADGNHSVPRKITLFADGIPVSSLSTPGKITEEPNGRETISFNNEAFDATSISINFDEVANRTTMDWYSGLPQMMPLGILEISGVPFTTDTTNHVDSGCRNDLLTVNNLPQNIRISGSASEVLKLETCDDSPLRLKPGEQTLRTKPGFLTGFDIDRLVLISHSLAEQSGVSRLMPEISNLKNSRTQLDLSISKTQEPYWLILGQSFSDGWRLKGAGRATSESPVLINGFANGWLIVPSSGETMDLSLSWEPQKTVWTALLVSIISILIFSLLALRSLPDLTQATSTPHFSKSKGASSRKLRLSHAILCGVCVLIFSLLNLPNLLLISLVVALLFFLTLRLHIADYVLLLSSFLFMGLASILIILDQIKERHPRDFVWPLFFERFHILGVVAILFIAAAAFYELLNSRYANNSR